MLFIPQEGITTTNKPHDRQLQLYFDFGDRDTYSDHINGIAFPNDHHKVLEILVIRRDEPFDHDQWVKSFYFQDGLMSWSEWMTLAAWSYAALVIAAYQDTTTSRIFTCAYELICNNSPML